MRHHLTLWLSSRWTSPTALTLLVGTVAAYFTYARTRICLALVALLVVQLGIGIWRRAAQKYSPWLAAIRLAAIAAVLLPFVYLDSYSVIWTNRIRFTLLGEVPKGISGLKTYEDIWTDYVITMHFHADSESVKRILTNGKFRQVKIFDDNESIIFEPVNLPETVLHRITVSKSYDVIFIEYAVD